MGKFKAKKVKVKKERTPKQKRNITIVWALIAVALAATVSGIIGYAYTPVNDGLTDTLQADTFFSSWQNNLIDEAKLVNTVIPGSHDAGTVGMMPLGETQGHTIADQLKGGVRYFDIRVTEKGDDLVIFHSVIKGQLFSEVLADIKEFTAANPTEFLVLDFQHLGKKVHAEVIAAITDTLDMSKAMKKSVVPDVTEVTMGEIRANGYNYIIVWTDKSDTSNIDYLYAREDYLSSPYDGKMHKKSIDKLLAHYQTYYDNYDGQRLFVLQAQRTASHLLGKPALLEKEYKSEINAYVKGLKTSANLTKTNIIMRDYVVSDMTNIKLILQLNLTKNLVKGSEIANFTEKTQID